MDVGEMPATLMSDLAAVVDRLRENTVELRSMGHAGGSGVIWRANGLIVTSAHVVGGARRAHHDLQVVLPDKRRLPAAVLEWDRQLDLALLRVEARGLPAAQVGDSSCLRPGELVLAVGHPYGLRGAVVTGVVHAAPARGAAGQPRWVQADLRLAPGNSGGPLADAGGQVVGINAMIVGRLALAVPSQVVQTFVMRSAPS
jgi:serine protease Do